MFRHNLRIQWALLTIFSVVLVSIAFSNIPCSHAAEQDTESSRELLAGAAASNITPPLGGPIIGGWRPIKATHVHDELYARCLVLDNHDVRLAFVVCDNLGMPQEVCVAAKKAVQEKTGIPQENVMISCTHTHSAVSARGPNKLVKDEQLSDYQQFIVSRIADGVQRAINNLEPAKIGWGSASEPTSVFNRRWYMKPGDSLRNPFGGMDKVRMNPPRGSSDLIKPAGPIDPEVAFFSVQSSDGRPIALLANYSLHYVGGVKRGSVSADYFGVFSDWIQELLDADRLDPPFVGIMTNGTSGDINNINFTKKTRKRYQPYEKMRQVAELVAKAVYNAHKNIEFHDWVELGAEQKKLTLDVRKPTKDQVAYAKKMLAKPEDEKPYHSREKVYGKRVLQVHESPDQINIILQGIRIGELGISTIPFEVLVEIGLELKDKSPFEQSFTISFANGSFGYLPTPEQHKLGGYETWLGTNVVEYEASNKIIDSLVSMHDELR